MTKNTGIRLYSVIFRLRKSIQVSCQWIKNSINCLNLNENDGKKEECETCLYRCAQQYWYIGYIKKRFIITDIWNNSYILTFLFLLLREINILRSAPNLLIFFSIHCNSHCARLIRTSICAYRDGWINEFIIFFVRPFADLTQITCIKPDIRFEFALLLSLTCRLNHITLIFASYNFSTTFRKLQNIYGLEEWKRTVQRRKITTINIVSSMLMDVPFYWRFSGFILMKNKIKRFFVPWLTNVVPKMMQNLLKTVTISFFFAFSVLFFYAVLKMCQNINLSLNIDVKKSSKARKVLKDVHIRGNKTSTP